MASCAFGIEVIIFLIFAGIIIFCIKASYFGKKELSKEEIVEFFNPNWGIEQFVMSSKCVQVEGGFFSDTKLTNERGEIIRTNKNYLDAITFVASIKTPKTMARVNDVVTVITF